MPNTAKKITEYERHPFSAMYPEPPQVEIKAMAADMKKRGQQESIWIYEGKILDGWMRYLACKEECIEPDTKPYLGNTPEEFSRSANWYRRHLPSWWRKDHAAELLKENPQLSNRALAEKANLDDKTVAKIRGELESGAEIPQVNERKGRDGKEYSAPAAAAPKPPKPVVGSYDFEPVEPVLAENGDLDFVENILEPLAFRWFPEPKRKKDGTFPKSRKPKKDGSLPPIKSGEIKASIRHMAVASLTALLMNNKENQHRYNVAISELRSWLRKRGYKHDDDYITHNVSLDIKKVKCSEMIREFYRVVGRQDKLPDWLA